MKTIYKFDTAGRCFASITGIEEIISINMQNIPDNELYIVDDNLYSWKDIYYKDKTIKQKPEAPNSYSIWDIQAEQWVQDTQVLKNEIISKRNQLLIQSDWTQLPDVPQAIKEKWAYYRQQLRDITAQPGFPENIVWPQPPQ